MRTQADITERRQHELRSLNQLAWSLDEQFVIPGTKIHFGWDAIIGLIPGLGDLTTSLFSLFIIFRAYRLQSSKILVLRMLLNVSIEMLAGVVPLLGNVFDIFWKANRRNIDLMERDWQEPVGSRRRSYAFIIGVLFLVFSFFALVTVGMYFAFLWLGNLIIHMTNS